MTESIERAIETELWTVAHRNIGDETDLRAIQKEYERLKTRVVHWLVLRALESDEPTESPKSEESHGSRLASQFFGNGM